jgi:hypothetical protein
MVGWVFQIGMLSIFRGVFGFLDELLGLTRIEAIGSVVHIC